MKLYLSTILGLSIALSSFGQDTFTGRKGSRFFPGHLHIVIQVDSNNVHYQLFNHWYSLSYAQYRDIKLPINELKSDSLDIELGDNKIKLTDKRFHLNRRIKHQKLCASIESMRKISYANSIAEQHKDMMHFHLYDHDDINLNEEEFRSLVDKNLKEKIK